MLTGIQIQSRSHAQSYNTATGYAQLHANQFKKIHQTTDSSKIINYEGIEDGSQITKLIVQYHRKIESKLLPDRSCQPCGRCPFILE